MPKACNRCGNCHVGVLLFAPLGFMVVFRNDWEQSLSEEDFDKWTRDFTMLVKVQSSSLRAFVDFVNTI